MRPAWRHLGICQLGSTVADFAPTASHGAHSAADAAAIWATIRTLVAALDQLQQPPLVESVLAGVSAGPRPPQHGGRAAGLQHHRRHRYHLLSAREGISCRQRRPVALSAGATRTICTSPFPSSAPASSSSRASPSATSSPGPESTPHVASLDRLLDLRYPATWYPLARQMRRKIVAHLGPTNSGKTYAALEALRASSSGVYCGPLRLLALEVWERLCEHGLPCRLVTGQEIGGEEGAQHIACTVEMASLNERVEVAVLDEVQMIADQGRGWGWTRALLGLPARTLHVCGAPEALPLLRMLAAECGDELEVRTYHRLSPLTVMNQALGAVQHLQEGDCLVAFSRRSVHVLKREVLRRTQHPCAVVYGALPPSTRRQQAALFNGLKAQNPTPSTSDSCPISDSTQQDECDGADGSAGTTDSDAEVDIQGPHGVLVATDAIGMGLNLNIRRVVFSTMCKYDGSKVRELTVQEVKQIAGRAGRFRSAHASGHVTCLHEDDLHALHKAMGTRSAALKLATLMPRPEDIAVYVMRHPGLRYDQALQQYAHHARLSPHYHLGDLENMLALASLLQVVSHHFSPEELYVFCVSPADSKDSAVSAALLRFASSFARDGCVPADLALPLHPLTLPVTEAELKSLEALHRVCDLYIWLAYRFSEQFPDRDIVEQARVECSAYIAMGLDRLTVSYRRKPSRHFEAAEHWDEDAEQDEDLSAAEEWRAHEDQAIRQEFEGRGVASGDIKWRGAADREDEDDEQGFGVVHGQQAGARLRRKLWDQDEDGDEDLRQDVAALARISQRLREGGVQVRAGWQ